MTAQPLGSPPAEAILLAASVNGAWLAATRHDRLPAKGRCCIAVMMRKPGSEVGQFRHCPLVRFLTTPAAAQRVASNLCQQQSPTDGLCSRSTVIRIAPPRLSGFSPDAPIRRPVQRSATSEQDPPHDGTSERAEKVHGRFERQGSRRNRRVKGHRRGYRERLSEAGASGTQRVGGRWPRTLPGGRRMGVLGRAHGTQKVWPRTALPWRWTETRPRPRSTRANLRPGVEQGRLIRSARAPLSVLRSACVCLT
jgi:hypothetical protein